MVLKRAQFKIQQMAFMLVAVFIFFTIVSLFVLQFSLTGIRRSAQELEKEQVIQSLMIWSELPELSCSERSSFCIDEDKLYVLNREEFNELYKGFWPVSSIKVYKISSDIEELVRCPALNCNYYEIFNDGQDSITEYSTYVSICRTTKKENEIFKECEMGKLALGIKIVD